MATKKYPLDEVLELRERREDEAKTARAAAVRGRAEAEAAAAAAEAERAAADEKARAVRSSETKALSEGELSVADLQRAGAWEHRVEAERRALLEKEDAEKARAAAALAAEAAAQATLAEKQADAKVIENDRARHVARVRREEEAKAEEEASEAWRSKG